MARRTLASHPTREVLISTVLQMLQSVSPDEIRLDVVLENSGVSSGSLYHHFGDFPGLIDEALVALYSADVDHGIDFLTSVITGAKTVEELSAGFHEATKRTQTLARQSSRFMRAQIMVRAINNDHFRLSLAPVQQRLTDAVADLLRELQERGFVAKSIEPHAASIFVQSYTLGFIVNDLGEHSVDYDDWVAIISRVIDKTFLER